MPATLPKFDGGISGRHLGRKKATPQMKAKALPLAPFVKRMGAKSPPDRVDYTDLATKSLATMLANDQLGDCTVAAVLHQGAAMAAEAPGGVERVPSNQEAVSQYQSICGAGDNGCYIPEVMDYWRDRGIVIGGKKVQADGYVSLTLGDELLAKIALVLFGPLHFGINLPNEWYTHASPGFVWGVTSSRIVGGHSIAIPGYDTNGFFVSTWGAVGTMTFEAFRRPDWVEEIYATLSPDWIGKDGLTAFGVNVSALKEALDVIKRGGTPDIPDNPNPPTPTPPGPGPNPPSPHEWSHTFDVFGYALRVYAGYSFDRAMMGAAKVEYWKLVQDVWHFGQALTAKDWNGVFQYAVAILADIGINIPMARVEAMVKGLKAHDETRPLAPENAPEWPNDLPVDDTRNRR